jgi:hypothetical protein
VQVKTKAIVLSSLKFQEKLDCKMFYLSHGLKSYLFGMLFQEGQIKKHFQLTILEIEAVHKRHFRKFKEIKSLRLFIPSIQIFTKHHGDVYFKLHHSIHEEEENEPLLHFRNRITLARQPR